MRKGGVYLAIGDSITWTGATRGADLYAFRVREAIKTNYAPIRLINKGIGGSDSLDAVRNTTWHSMLDPDLITIGLGMNDAANNVIPVTQYKDNLRKLIDNFRIKNSEVSIVLCTPSRSSEASRSDLASYRTAMAEVATEKNVGLARFENAFTDGEIATYCPDGIHPNSAGHQKLYDVLWPVIQSTADKWLNKLQ
ncbi:SGNH/GDSL hydrolase family protein [Metabacillus dongyingensis]|uniref:SGNH/GDSL hydrolase family protein n=1 Tax=Metabacillus dongyingensis TaxID=2874282 RepID=UPI003B8B9046